jgi:hypothetical protein
VQKSSVVMYDRGVLYTLCGTKVISIPISDMCKVIQLLAIA